MFQLRIRFPAEQTKWFSDVISVLKRYALDKSRRVVLLGTVVIRISETTFVFRLLTIREYVFRKIICNNRRDKYRMLDS